MLNKQLLVEQMVADLNQARKAGAAAVLTERQREILAAADEVRTLDQSHRDCPAGTHYLRSQERLYAAIDRLTDAACQPDEPTTTNGRNQEAGDDEA